MAGLTYILPDEKILLDREITDLEEELDKTKAVNVANDAGAEGRDAAESGANNEHVSVLLERMRRRVETLNNSAVYTTPIDITKVGIGTRVKLIINERECEYTIGGHGTTVTGRVAYTAPLIQKIIGWEVGDGSEVALEDNRIFDVEVLSIKAYTPHIVQS